MSCAAQDIKKNLTVNCDYPLAKGIGETIFIGRIPEIDTVAYDSTNKKLITNLVLKSGKKLKRYIGQNFSNQVSVGFAANEYGNNLPHGLRYILFSNDVADETELDALAQLTDLFAIVRKVGNGVQFKVYGFQTGFRMSSLNSDSNDDTLKGAYIMEFSAPAETKSPFTLKHMTGTNPATDDTETFLEGLALTIS